MGVEMSLSLSLKAASICIWKKALSQSSRLQKTPGGDLSNAFIVGFKKKKKKKQFERETPAVFLRSRWKAG